MIKIKQVTNQKEFAEVLSLRYEVFVYEQGVPAEIEHDKADETAVHVQAVQENTTVGCGRLEINSEQAKIGRMAVKKEYRGQRIGSKICRYLIELALARGCSEIILHAQVTAKSFYEKLGFQAKGEVFQEAGIDHVKMEFDFRE